MFYSRNIFSHRIRVDQFTHLILFTGNSLISDHFCMVHGFGLSSIFLHSNPYNRSGGFKSRYIIEVGGELIKPEI